MNTLKDYAFKAGVKLNTIRYNLALPRESFKAKLEGKRKGAFAFEYIIILVLMVAIIFAAWEILTPVIMQKVQDIADIVSNNGV